MCVWTTLTHVVQVQGQVLVLEQGIVGETGTLYLLKEGADVPAVEDVQQHDAGDAQTHVEHRLHPILQCHGLSSIRSAGRRVHYDGMMTVGALWREKKKEKFEDIKEREQQKSSVLTEVQKQTTDISNVRITTT